MTSYVQRMNADVVKTSLAVENNNHSVYARTSHHCKTSEGESTQHAESTWLSMQSNSGFGLRCRVIMSGEKKNHIKY